ncbi:MAG TPA: hypothetical protein VFC68_00500 [Treponemataceae bacterium]|nr:hypothetical protein [Treponemataceae bacterium]
MNNTLYRVISSFFIMLVLVVIQTAAQSTVESTKKTQSDDAEHIVLPDVSTKLGLDRQDIDKAAIPDFTTVLPDSIADRDNLPVLQDGTDEVSALTAISQKQTDAEIVPVYLEGIIAGGYPGIFTGKFNVYQTSGSNPFSISFSHEAINGYGRHKVSEGFNNSETSLLGSKKIRASEKIVFDGKAEYNTSTWGLQNKSPFFYNMSRQYLGALVQMETQFNEGFLLKTSVVTSHVSRFAGFTGILSDGILTDSSIVLISPSIKGIYTKGKLLAAFEGEYSFTSFDSSVSKNNDIVHYANAGLGLSYTFFECIQTEAGIEGVFSTNAHTYSMLPFYGGLRITAPFVNLGLKGGLESDQTDTAALQKKHPYVQFENAPKTETLWFGVFDAYLPFMQKYAINLNLNFAKTAFDNLQLLPNYSQKTASGMYKSSYQDTMSLFSVLAFSMQFSHIGIDAGWNARWLDVAANSKVHEVFANFSYAASNEMGGLQIQLLQALVKPDFPQIRFLGFYQIAQSIQVELALNDMLLLFTGEDRLIAGDYCGQGGSFSLGMKLFF